MSGRAATMRRDSMLAGCYNSGASNWRWGRTVQLYCGGGVGVDAGFRDGGGRVRDARRALNDISRSAATPIPTSNSFHLAAPAPDSHDRETHPGIYLVATAVELNHICITGQECIYPTCEACPLLAGLACEVHERRGLARLGAEPRKQSFWRLAFSRAWGDHQLTKICKSAHNSPPRPATPNLNIP